MYLKAISKRKKREYARKGFLILLAVLLCIFLCIIGDSIYKTVMFNKSLPDPSLATEVSIYHSPGGSVIFCCGDNSIVSLGEGAKFSDFLSYSGSHVDVLFLSDVTETTFDNLMELYYYGDVGTVYVPKEASKEFVERLERKHGEETQFIRLTKRGERFVLGEMVVRVFSADTSIAFTITHGTDNFLVASEPANLSVLKDTSIAVAIAPLEAVKGLEKIDAFLCKVPKGGVEPAVDDVVDVCKRFAVTGSRLIFGYRTNEGFDFDTSFVLTGKLE